MRGIAVRKGLDTAPVQAVLMPGRLTLSSQSRMNFGQERTAQSFHSEVFCAARMRFWFSPFSRSSYLDAISV